MLDKFTNNDILYFEQLKNLTYITLCFFKDEVFIFNASKEKQEAINISKSINYLARNYFDEIADVEIDVIVLAIIKKLANKENVN